MSCEICGNDLRERGIKVRVEGAVLIVCRECSELGERIHDEHREGSLVKSSASRPKSAKPAAAAARKPAAAPGSIPVYPKKKPQSEEFMDLVENFADVIKKARGDMKMEEFAATLSEKASVIQKIETGKLKPTIKLAKRIEKQYKIILVERHEEAEDIEDVVMKTEKKNDYSPTLGDYIKKQD
jgi:putative transcription factor